MPKTTFHPNRNRAAISLIEVVVSTLIVSFVIVSALQTVAASATTRARTHQLLVGPSLARDLLAEVLQYGYADPDSESGTIGLDSGEGSSNRQDFDDIDDFDGWSSPSAVTSDGAAIASGVGWQRQVSVTWVDPADLSASVVESGLKRIAVTVVEPVVGRVTVVEALRSELGASERQPHADREFVVGATVSIQQSPVGDTVRSSFFSRNHSLDQ